MKNFLIDALTPSATQTLYNMIINLAKSVDKKTRLARSDEIGTQISNMICEFVASDTSIKENKNFEFNPKEKELLKTHISKLILNMSDTDFFLFEESLNHSNTLIAKLPETVKKYTYSWNILGPLAPLGSLIKFALSFTCIKYLINIDDNSYLYLTDRTKATQEIEEKFKTMIQELKHSEAKNYYFSWFKSGAVVVAILFLTSITALLKSEDSAETLKSFCSIQ